MIRSIPPAYRVAASLKVDNKASTHVVESLIDNVNLIEEKSTIADEIVLLKSFDLVKQVCLDMELYKFYFQPFTFSDHELYHDRPFQFHIDLVENQIINIPIEISFLSSNTYTIHIESSKKPEIFNFTYDLQVESSLESLDYTDTLKVGDHFSTDFLSFTLLNPHGNVLSSNTSFSVLLQNPNFLAEEYQKKLSIETINKEASIIEIEIQSTVPAKDIDFINYLVSLYTKRQFDSRNRVADQIIEFIDRQLLGISDSLQNAELELKDLRINSDLTISSNNLYEEFNDVERLLSDEQIKYKYYEYLIDYITNADNFNDIIAPSVMGIQDPTLNNLINTLTQYTTEMTTIYFSAKEKNPRYAILLKNIENTRKAILENVNNIKISSRIRLNDLKQKSAQIKKGIDALPENERVMVNAQRKFDFNDNIYTYYLQRKSEAAIFKESNTTVDVVVDKARQIGQEAVTPNKKKMLLVFLVAGLFIPLGFIFGRDLIVKKIRSALDIKSLAPSLLILENIPRSPSKKKSSPIFTDDPTYQSFRSLKHKVMKKIQNGIICITSLREKDGKTFCATKLAMSLARDKQTVALLSLDSTNHKPVAGQENAVGELTFDTSAIPHVTLAFPSMNDANTIDYFFSKQNLEHLLKDLSHRFDYVLIDCSDVKRSADFQSIKQFSDLNIIVVRKDHSPADFSKLYLEEVEMCRSFIVYNCSNT